MYSCISYEDNNYVKKTEKNLLNYLNRERYIIITSKLLLRKIFI